MYLCIFLYKINFKANQNENTKAEADTIPIRTHIFI